VFLVAVLAAAAIAPAEAGRRPHRPPPGGGGGGGTGGPVINPLSSCGALTASEVTGLLNGAATAVGFPNLVVAVVDRPGNVLGLYLQGSPTLADEDLAVGLARTGAFFSNDQAPLSSRTVRFISGLHFPPGIARTPNAALYGIENTNRGCDLNVTFNSGQSLPRATSVAGGPCDAAHPSGCGTGPVTGKVVDLSGNPVDRDSSAVNPGGLPVFRGGTLVGGIGVAGVPAGQLDAAEFAAFSAAVSVAGLTPFPVPLPDPGVVFIDGIRLPFVRQTQRPTGVPAGSASGSLTVTLPAIPCAPDGYLVGPLPGSSLSAGEVNQIVQQAVAAAGRTRAMIRLPIGQRTRMAIAVGDVDDTVLALYRMPDSTVFSVDVAVAKARNVAWFSGPGAGDVPRLPAGTAITNRTISFGAQPLFPVGIDGSGPGPFFNLFQHDTLHPCTQGSATGPNRNGIVFFPGSLPLYKGSVLVGGLGVSGDGVEQDDYVTFLGAQGFLPPQGLQADNFFVDGVRMPFLKLPRNPEQ
jgi:uncharacterized protein GlcG (DUF336 family)